MPVDEAHVPETAEAIHLAAVPLDEPIAPPVDDMVIRSGRICRAGAYPSHDWTLTPDDIKLAAAAYDGSGYLEVEHFRSKNQPSILDGQLGELRRVWASDDGQELYGDVALPVWLDELAGKAGRKVSAVWDRATKSLRGLGLVLDPAVPDAALLSAFVTFAKRHDTPHGQMAMQDLHDSAVRHGATCAAGNAVGMASAHEAVAVQAIHNLAVTHGAACEALPTQVGRPPGRAGPPGAMTFSAASPQPQSDGGRDTDTGADDTAGNPPDDATDTQEKEIVPMAETTTNTDTASKPQSQQGPTIAELKALLDAEKADRAEQHKAFVALQAERRVEKADLWVDKLVTEGVIVPAERDLLVKLHVMAATDDDTSGLVALSDGGKESRLVTLLSALSVRKPMGLTREQIAANPKVTVLLNRQKTDEDPGAENDPDADDRLLAMTPMGRQALERKRASGRH